MSRIQIELPKDNNVKEWEKIRIERPSFFYKHCPNSIKIRMCRNGSFTFLGFTSKKDMLSAISNTLRNKENYGEFMKIMTDQATLKQLNNKLLIKIYQAIR